MSTKEKIIVALDVSSRQEALQIVRELHDVVGMFKIGSQLFTACGPQLVREVINGGGKVFLDLKFHDIPNTVTHAAGEAAKLGVSMLTIHASGGRAMMQSVAENLRDRFSSTKPLVVAVTVLTSIDTRTLFEIGLEIPVEEQVERLALLAQDCGIDGVVCSPREIQALRERVNPGFKIVTPGIRMPEQSLDDQQRTSTPREAIAAGADYLVVGRAVTGDPDRRAAIQKLLQSI
jgi:orotidine-5'-phosphate decarboxylase